MKSVCKDFVGVWRVLLQANEFNNVFVFNFPDAGKHVVEELIEALVWHRLEQQRKDFVKFVKVR